MPRLAYILLVVFTACAGSPAQACNVPVFRYALERWRSDEYEFLIFHRGPLADDDQAAINGLRELSVNGTGQANFVVQAHDTAGDLAAPLRELHVAAGEPTAAHLVVRSPRGERPPATLFQLPLAAENLARIYDSPARQEVLRRLFSGHAVVWVLVPGTNAEQNKQIAERLSATLPKLEQSLRVPEGIGADGFHLLTNIPLAIKFSVLEVSRDDPAEREFLTLLFAGQADLEKNAGPICFPMFGRGRVLAPLSGDDLAVDVLGEAAAFLCGACSCQVKQLNPGFDVVLKADWEKLFDDVSVDEEARQMVAASEETATGPATAPEYVPIPASAPPAATELAAAASALPERLSDSNHTPGEEILPPGESPSASPSEAGSTVANSFGSWSTLWLAGALVAISAGLVAWTLARSPGAAPFDPPAS